MAFARRILLNNIEAAYNVITQAAFQKGEVK
jgi:hypothetical protein